VTVAPAPSTTGRRRGSAVAGPAICCLRTIALISYCRRNGVAAAALILDLTTILRAPGMASRDGDRLLRVRLLPNECLGWSACLD
jgi:hypothetical protein